MNKITSRENPLVKQVSLLNKKASLRKEEGLFVVEGRRFAEEIPAERLERAFVTEAFRDTAIPDQGLELMEVA